VGIEKLMEKIHCIELLTKIHILLLKVTVTAILKTKDEYIQNPWKFTRKPKLPRYNGHIYFQDSQTYRLDAV